MKSSTLQPTQFEDFGVPLFLIGDKIPAPLRDLVPEGLNWIMLSEQPNVAHAPPDQEGAKAGHQTKNQKLAT